MLLHDGELPPERAEQVRTHVATCDRCAAWMGDLASVGAVVRGEVIPALSSSPAWSPTQTWRPAPIVTRLLPAVAAVVAVALGLVIAQPPQDTEVSLGGRSSVESVTLPTRVPAGPSTGAPGSSAPDQPGATNSTGAPAPGGGSPDTEGPSETAGTTTETITLGVLVPGGQTGAGEPVVRAVAVALAQANDAGAVPGARLELLVADASDPTAGAQLAERGARAVVGGYGASASTVQALAGRGIPWFGPTDLAPASPAGMVTVEVGHQAAGRLVGDALRQKGFERAVALSGPGDERHLTEGLKTRMTVEGTTVDESRSCGPYLDTAALTGAETIVLAMARDALAGCVSALRQAHPFHTVVVPATALDDALSRLPAGFALVAALGAPAPDDPGAGPTRFRSATGIDRNYRAMVSFAAAEVAVASLNHDRQDPLAGFMKGGQYRSDLLTLNPQVSPPNVSPQVVFLGSVQIGLAPPAGSQQQSSQQSGEPSLRFSP